MCIWDNLGVGMEAEKKRQMDKLKTSIPILRHVDMHFNDDMKLCIENYNTTYGGITPKDLNHIIKAGFDIFSVEDVLITWLGEWDDILSKIEHIHIIRFVDRNDIWNKIPIKSHTISFKGCSGEIRGHLECEFLHISECELDNIYNITFNELIISESRKMIHQSLIGKHKVHYIHREYTRDGRWTDHQRIDYINFIPPHYVNNIIQAQDRLNLQSK